MEGTYEETPQAPQGLDGRVERGGVFSRPIYFRGYTAAGKERGWDTGDGPIMQERLDANMVTLAPPRAPKIQWKGEHSVILERS